MLFLESFLFSNLYIEETPSIDFPIVTVKVIYPGATPLEVETLVVKKVEEAVAELSEIEKIRSESYDNFGFVFIEFLLSADINVKLIEVKDKIDAITNDLPDDIEKPVIEKYDPLVEPVMDLVLASDTLSIRDLYEYADKKLKDRFSSVEGVASVDLYGGRERQINIWLDPMLMAEKYITITDVITQVKAENRNIPGGLLEKNDNALSLRFLGEFDEVDDIRNLIMVSGDGNEFVLGEIATVEDSFKKIDSIARFNAGEVVGLSLKKVSDGNAVSIAKEIRKRLPEIMALLPDDVSLTIAADTTTFIVGETISTERNILLGILLTVLILLIFTGHFNLTFIASIVIPTSIVSTMFLMDAADFTINMVTLLAIATSLGTLIANAIVIIENVLVHLEKGDNAVQGRYNRNKRSVFSGACIYRDKSRGVYAHRVYGRDCRPVYVFFWNDGCFCHGFFPDSFFFPDADVMRPAA